LIHCVLHWLSDAFEFGSSSPQPDIAGSPLDRQTTIFHVKHENNSSLANGRFIASTTMRVSLLRIAPPHAADEFLSYAA